MMFKSRFIANYNLSLNQTPSRKTPLSPIQAKKNSMTPKTPFSSLLQTRKSLLTKTFLLKLKADFTKQRS